MLGILDRRVAIVEDRLGSVVDGIAKIIAELGARSHGCGKDVEARTSAHIRNMSHAPVHDATTTPSQQQQGESPQQAGGMDAEKPSSPRPAKQSNADDVDDRGAILDLPIVVGDDASSSGGNKGCNMEGSPSKGAVISKRVHANSRQRVVPFAGSLYGPQPRMAPAGAREGTGFYVAPHAPKQKDPCGYAGGTDSARTLEPAFVPPVLEPKRSGVSNFPNQVNIVFGVACALLDALYVLLLVSTARLKCLALTGVFLHTGSTEAQHQVLGVAPRIQQRGRGSGQSGCAQQVPQPPEAFGSSMQRQGAVHIVQKNLPPRHSTPLPR